MCGEPPDAKLGPSVVESYPVFQNSVIRHLFGNGSCIYYYTFVHNSVVPHFPLFGRTVLGYNSGMEPTIQRHIESVPGKCGGKPCIAGTRIRVWDIHVWHNLRGESPEQIITSYPQLGLADVYAALAYYLDHRDEIERQAAEDRDLVAQLEAEQGPTRFTRLRDQLLRDKNLLRDKDVHDDSVSS